MHNGAFGLTFADILNDFSLSPLVVRLLGHEYLTILLSNPLNVQAMRAMGLARGGR